MGDDTLSIDPPQEAAVPALPAAEDAKTDPGKHAAAQQTSKAPQQRQPGQPKGNGAMNGTQTRAAFGEVGKTATKGQHGGGNARGLRGKLGEQVQAAMRKGMSSEAMRLMRLLLMRPSMQPYSSPPTSC